MYLNSVVLTHFRNYSDCSFKFSSPITVFLGDNAQGKTNFLEAVYFLATSKSFKAEKEDELIIQDNDYLRVSGEIETAARESVNLEIALQHTPEGLRKKIKVNGIPRRLIDYSGNLVVVEFLPEDIGLVGGSPSSRRDHIDRLLSQIDREYKRALSNYERVLTSKNRLLKNIREGFSKTEELDFWLEKQLELGQVLVEKRKELFIFLNSAEKKFGNFLFEYKENLLTRQRQDEYKGKEIDSAASLIGPHRDDFHFFLEQKDLAKYGSRGEQRTAVMDLKITEVEFIESKISSRPVLLLDDIFSELDVEHQRHVLELARMQQTIITGVEFNEILKKEVLNASFFSVADGQISEITDKL